MSTVLEEKASQRVTSLGLVLEMIRDHPTKGNLYLGFIPFVSLCIG
jgi:hypothetical protein